jgi:hypothetical protein
MPDDVRKQDDPHHLDLPDPELPYVTVLEVAGQLGFSDQTVYNWIRAKKLPAATRRRCPCPARTPSGTTPRPRTFKRQAGLRSDERARRL